MFLLEQIKGQNYIEKNFFDLKQNAEKESYQMGGSGQYQGEDFNLNKFNDLFNQNRLEDEDFDSGYGDWKTDNPATEPAKIFNQKFTMDVFNQVFNEFKSENAKTSQIQVYEEPKPLSVSNRFGYSDVDYKKTTDYSKEYDIQDGSSRNGIYYMDYKRAYTETTLIDPNSVPKKQEYKRLEDYQTVREKQEFDMTDEERAYYEEKKRKEAQDEMKRQERLRRRDDQLAEHSSKINKLLLSSGPAIPTRQLEYQRR